MSQEFIKRILSSIVILPIAFFFILKGSIYFIFFVLVILSISLYEWHYLSLKKIYYLPGFIFIIFSFYTCYFFRNEGDYKYFLLILITCISTDIGGYFFGKILKGPKLHKISPNKTYSGMIGGFILSIISSIFYYNNLSFFTQTNDTEMNIRIITIVLYISFVSQFGDFVISFFKRKSNFKNTGNIIPGHGGLLDRIDGMIFAFPFTYILLKVL